ncbi:hypothetical protein RM531_08530 [Salinisphaera sp. P385]|uniref:Uncharacterized protein n=1 Tax=Spectribacter acetivorans TaxID=3075603 RepID=A0ABU3B7S7_9GAMM|nr:hypothetical protein [Salinisphaera sp. P385]MDT0618522.1 hypothetical protein [Salinisphaera sp. P385]
MMMLDSISQENRARQILAGLYDLACHHHITRELSGEDIRWRFALLRSLADPGIPYIHPGMSSRMQQDISESTFRLAVHRSQARLHLTDEQVANLIEDSVALGEALRRDNVIDEWLYDHAGYAVEMFLRHDPRVDGQTIVTGMVRYYLARLSQYQKGHQWQDRQDLPLDQWLIAIAYDIATAVTLCTGHADYALPDMLAKGTPRDRDFALMALFFAAGPHVKEYLVRSNADSIDGTRAMYAIPNQILLRVADNRAVDYESLALRLEEITLWANRQDGFYEWKHASQNEADRLYPTFTQIGRHQTIYTKWLDLLHPPPDVIGPKQSNVLTFPRHR